MLTKTRICIGVIALMLTGAASAGMKVMNEHELNSITGQAFIKVNYDMVANFAEDVVGYHNYWHAIYDRAIEGTFIEETIDPKIVTPSHNFNRKNIYLNALQVPGYMGKIAGTMMSSHMEMMQGMTGGMNSMMDRMMSGPMFSKMEEIADMDTMLGHMVAIPSDMHWRMMEVDANMQSHMAMMMDAMTSDLAYNIAGIATVMDVLVTHP